MTMTESKATGARDWSPYQQAIFNFVRTGRGSAAVKAVAGSGKTTTAVEAVRLMGGSVAFAAYNKAIAVEIEARIAPLGLGNRVRAATVHSFGYSPWRRAHPRVKLARDGEKDDQLIADLRVPRELQGFTTQLVSLAKQAAFGVYADPANDAAWWGIVEHHDLGYNLEDPDATPEGVRLAKLMLARSVAMAPELIDFDDMVYMPVLRPVKVWQNDWLVVDEYQDLNAARRALCRKMLRPGGRALFFGDPCQAIYGFTGADADAVERAAREFNCTELPLTVSYRCPRAVVREAQEVVDYIEASPDAPEGKVSRIRQDALLDQGLGPQDAILCRLTAPLVKQAFKLIRKGVACHVEGRKIGEGLLKLARRWKVKDMDGLHQRLEEYREREVAKLTAKGQETKAEAINDQVETLLVIMDGCADLDCVSRKIGDMFQDGVRNLTLATVHRSKGREWERVFILGRHAYMPSPWARQAWQQDQERNLIYVAVTRSMGRLVYVEPVAEPR